jgi:hypothetical protein
MGEIIDIADWEFGCRQQRYLREATDALDRATYLHRVGRLDDLGYAQAMNGFLRVGIALIELTGAFEERKSA